MNLSPLEIRKHEFRKKLRGYDPDEVMAFLDIVSMEYENMVHQNSMLTERLAMIESQIKKYRNMEATLQDALLSAERSREETLKTAKKQAELIVREAEIKASAILEEGRHALVRLRNTFSELKTHKDVYFAKLKALVNAQSELFAQYSFAEERAFEKFEEKTDSTLDERKPQNQQRRVPAQKTGDSVARENPMSPNRAGDMGKSE